MGRTVVTQKDVARRSRAVKERAAAEAEQGMVASGTTPPLGPPDTYRDRLLKYIPGEIVAIYLALLSVLRTASAETTPIRTVEWVVFATVLIVTVPWQRRVMKVTKWQQVAIGTVAFVFWAISLGEPFNSSWKAWYRPLYGTMAMMFYTFLIPMFEAEA